MVKVSENDVHLSEDSLRVMIDEAYEALKPLTRHTANFGRACAENTFQLVAQIRRMDKALSRAHQCMLADDYSPASRQSVIAEIEAALIEHRGDEE